MKGTQTQSMLLSVMAGFILGVSVSMLYGMHHFCIVSTANGGVVAEHRRTLEPRDVGDTRCVSPEQLIHLTKLAQAAAAGGAFNIRNDSVASPSLKLGKFRLPGQNTGAMPPPADLQALRDFLYPKDKILLKRKGTAIGTPNLLKEEYFFKRRLFVGVMTREEYLPTRAKVVYETWGAEVDKVVFFVGEDCNIPPELSHLPIVKLTGIPDNVYPPLKKAFAVMQYMYENFADRYNWFVRADDDMYVRGKKLQGLLESLNHNEKIYLGRAGTGRPEDLKRLNLLPYERYCMGGPGVFFSSAAIRGIGPHLSTCLEAIMFHDKHMKDDQEWNDDDVEIGRCVSRKLDIQCSTSAESRYYFQFDYHGNILNAMLLWAKPEYQDLVSIHPVKNPENMKAIHHFFKTMEFEARQDKLYNMSQNLNSLCKSLPVHLLPPPLASPDGCDLSVQSCKNCYDHERGSKTFGSYLVKKDRIPYFHNPVDQYEIPYWKTFNTKFSQEFSTMTPEHDLSISFRAELEHMFGLVEPYVNSKHHSELTLFDIHDGYVRYNHRVGPEYILTLKFAKNGDKDNPVYHRVRLVRPLQPVIYIMDEPLPDVTTNIILPVKAVDDHLREFMTMLVNNVGKAAVQLVVVVFSQTDAKAAELTISQEMKKVHSPIKVTMVISHGGFNWTNAVESGMSVLKKPNDLAFVADVDLRIRHRFWEKCRVNAVHGNRVYFPTVFQTYKTDYRYTPGSFPSIRLWNGHWAVYSLKYVCIYKADYDAIGGYVGSSNVNDLFERAVKYNLEVMQAPDLALFQSQDSTRICSSSEGPTEVRGICRAMEKGASLDQVDIVEYLAGLLNRKHNRFKFAAERRTDMQE